jgi:putative addiction module component (TIGR02574 family)
MSTNFDDYKKLSVAERIQLVEDIWDSIATEDPESFRLSEAQKKELRRRTVTHQTDPSTSIPWEQVREKLFQHSS